MTFTDNEKGTQRLNKLTEAAWDKRKPEWGETEGSLVRMTER